MMRPDIDGIEVQSEGEHHHRVLRARRESDNDVGDPKRKEATTISANDAATATATANEPKAAPR